MEKKKEETPLRIKKQKRERLRKKRKGFFCLKEKNI
jgi:hypothetical protein